jgi:HAD superfamily hydrolase (TIGR01549 family)
MIKDKNIKVIIFDFIGVLGFKRQDYIANNIVDGVDALAGGVTNDFDFKKEVQEKFNLTDGEFESVLEKIADKYEPNLDLWKLLPEIKNKFKSVVIINNGTTLTLPYFNKKFNFQEFDDFICSAAVGISKPDSEIFRLCISKLGVEFENCLFMDDNLENVDAAEKLGMEVIFWKDRGQGMRDFLKFMHKIG